MLLFSPRLLETKLNPQSLCGLWIVVQQFPLNSKVKMLIEKVCILVTRVEPNVIKGLSIIRILIKRKTESIDKDDFFTDLSLSKSAC